MVQTASTPSCTVLAIDLGASGGKAFVATLAGERLRLTEVHRFSNRAQARGDHLVWDLDRIAAEIDRAIARALDAPTPPRSVGIDGWAVDHVLLDASGGSIGPVYAYRDSRAERGKTSVHLRIS